MFPVTIKIHLSILVRVKYVDDTMCKGIFYNTRQLHELWYAQSPRFVTIDLHKPLVQTPQLLLGNWKHRKLTLRKTLKQAVACTGSWMPGGRTNSSSKNFWRPFFVLFRHLQKNFPVSPENLFNWSPKISDDLVLVIYYFTIFFTNWVVGCPPPGRMPGAVAPTAPPSTCHCKEAIYIQELGSQRVKELCIMYTSNTSHHIHKHYLWTYYKCICTCK